VLDLKLIREDPDAVKAALKRRGSEAALVDDVLAVDAERRGAQKRIDDLRAEQNQAGRDVVSLQGKAKQGLLVRLKSLSDEIRALEAALTEHEARQRALLLEIPNLPHEDVPEGGPESNVVLREWGAPPAFDFEPRDHLALGEGLGIIDMERGAKVSGTRFSILRGKGAMLWVALKRFALDVLEQEGHTVVLPPVLVRRSAMEGTGIFPTGEEQIYHLERDELYLAGTSEVPLAAMHMDEMLDPDALPLRYVAHSACFRREAGTHGKDTRGIFRNHQFEKAEMYVLTRADRSWEEHERLVGIQERITQALGIPHRTMLLAAGDVYPASAKTIDLEYWFPGEARYRETTSCSNTTDYQARRLNLRMRGAKGPVFAHTLNGTVATSSRTIAALLENNQRRDGSVEVPEVLRTSCGFDAIEPR
jgi:seryl-tRNA synthetase